MPNCENLRIGREFLISNNWPSEFYNTDFDRCYCKECYPSSYKDTYNVGGNIYVIARGWTRFAINIDKAFFEVHKVWKTWSNCYHGTSLESAKNIIRHRQILIPGDTAMTGEILTIRKGHIPRQNYIFTTPSIAYAAYGSYSHTYNFKSSTNQKRYKIKVVLQCKQMPGSFIVQQETIRATQRLCPHIPNNKIEWKTDRRSTVVPYGLMLQIVDTTKNYFLGTSETVHESMVDIITEKFHYLTSLLICTIEHPLKIKVCEVISDESEYIVIDLK